MANRTTATEVKQIIDTDLDDTIVTAFISDANPIVTDAIGSDTTLSSAQKASIEKWLSAHLIASTRDQQAAKEGDDDATITYQGKWGMGLDATSYGQMVKLLDTTGKIAASIGKKRASLKAVTSFE